MSLAMIPGTVLGGEASRSVLRETAGRPVHGAAHIGEVFKGLIRSAGRELLGFDDPAGPVGQDVPDDFPASVGACVHESAPRSATIRWIAPRRGLARAVHAGTVWHCPGDARVTDSIPFPIIVADRAVAAVPLDLGLFHKGMLVIRDPVLVQALVRTHRAWWETGEDLGPRTVPRVLPPPQREVLQALLAGLTDDAAAVKLGMSRRTYSRRVGELLADLGTTSRFRAGAEAARRGWI
ncbi:DNA-binding response regulator [Streptomyces sp. NPDC020141]|uniref:DNA-binding response regulator n=1 Tax=Streptomyces sp. NPDC020141 TaxID=3365065 RepID=UPI0037B35888